MADFLDHRLPIQNFEDFHPEENFLEIFLNPTSIISNDHAMLNILDMDLKTEDINYDLYTKENKEQVVSLRVDDTAQLKDSPFSPAWPTKIIIHGWIDSGNASWLHDIRRNYLSIGDYNVIYVDWFAGSSKEYVTSVKLTRQVNQSFIWFIKVIVYLFLLCIFIRIQYRMRFYACRWENTWLRSLNFSDQRLRFLSTAFIFWDTVWAPI